MAINKQIKIARGSHKSIADLNITTSDKLVAWEPIYDKDRKYLYIWNGTTDDLSSLKLNPITTNRIIGYVNDEGEEYSFSADDTGAFIKSNTAQFNVKDSSNNSILKATDSNLIFKGNLWSGDKIIYTSSSDTLIVKNITSGSGGNLNNFSIDTGNKNITTGSGTILTSNSITTPKILGFNNALTISAPSGVTFDGKIISDDLLINSRADIREIIAEKLTISKANGVGISCYNCAIATKEIQAPSTNNLNINASSGVIFNGNITAEGKTITAGKFIGDLQVDYIMPTDVPASARLDIPCKDKNNNSFKLMFFWG